MNFKIYNKVKIINKETKKLIKRGHILSLTTSFAQVWDKDEAWDHPSSAQFFPFESREEIMLLSS